MLIHNSENLISQFLKKIKEKNEINFPSNIYTYTKLIFLAMQNDSTVGILCNCFIILNEIKTKEREEIKIFCKQNGKKYVFLLIQKYIIFIQSFYKALKIDMMELLNLMTETEIESEEITQFNTAGIVPLVLTYLNNCEIDYLQFLEFVSKFSIKNTMTVINVLEKLNLNIDVNSILSEKMKINLNEQRIMKLKLNIFHLFNFYSFQSIILNKNSFHIDDLLLAIKNIPIIRRRRKNLNDIVKFLIEICSEISIEKLEEQSVNFLMTTLMSLLYFKKNIRSAFIHSTCLFYSKSFEYLPEDNLNEFIYTCFSCEIKICLICVHRCHVGHHLSPIGYSFYRCECNSSNLCQALTSLDLPSHIQKINPSIIENENDESKSRSEYKLNLPSITLSEKSSDRTIQIGSTPKDNIYISTECNTLTIKTDNPVCNVIEVIKEIEFVSDILNEDTLYYFEIDIVMGGYFDQIAIGVTTNENYPSNEFAGYLDDSVGYHGDDGKCFVNSNSFIYGSKFGSNDIIGCGITTNGNVYFTHNGSLLPLLDVKLKGEIYSIVSLRGKYCSVKMNHFSNKIGINSPIFKQEKQKMYKNPINIINHSNSICKIIMAHENFMELIQRWCKNFKNAEGISRKFNRYCLTMHSLCKIKKRILIKYLVLTDIKIKNEVNKFDYIETNEIQINPKVKISSENENSKEMHSEKVKGEFPNIKTDPTTKIEPIHNNEDVCKCGKQKCMII